ncbi:MAG: DUF3108 domain-containing protein [Burkholderiaceae bacterium]|nr:DUF3108 domain-containing protein [Burkholderiaceae bacterium]
MTHALRSPHRAAPPRHQLLLATALALTVHALLLLGLPHFGSGVHAGEQGAAFVTRVIVPPVPRAATPEAEPTPVETQPQQPLPQPAPKPHPATPRRTPPPKPSDTTALSTQTKGSLEPQASLLTAPPLRESFGGGILPAMIEPPLPAEAAATALQFAHSAGDAPVQVAPAAQLTYRTVGHFGGAAFDLQTVLDWRQDGSLYSARWSLYTPRIGEYTRSVTGLLSPQGLVPVLATLRRPEAQDIRFDYTAQQIHFGAPDIDAPLRPGAQDRVGVLLQLGALLAGDAKRYPVGTRIDLPAVHPSGPGIWRFTVEAKEKVTALNDRSLSTLRLTHQPEGDDSPRMEVWLGAALNYLPVRLRVTEPNGDTAEYTILTAYTQTIPPSAPPPQ